MMLRFAVVTAVLLALAAFALILAILMAVIFATVVIFDSR